MNIHDQALSRCDWSLGGNVSLFRICVYASFRHFERLECLSLKELSIYSRYSLRRTQVENFVHFYTAFIDYGVLLTPVIAQCVVR